MRLRVGSRASALARAQTAWVVDRLREEHADLEVEVVLIKTSGDRIRDTPLAQVGGKGLFVKEIESALLANEIDCAVHSMKDLPGQIPAALTIAAVPAREDPRDVMVTHQPGVWPDSMRGLRVGTCSPRRAALVRGMGLGVEIVPLRGNVETRLTKVSGGAVDATLLAAAGLRRLGLSPANRVEVATDELIPAVGQGSLAIEARRGEHTALLAAIEDRDSRIAADAERSFLAGIGGDCVSPIAAFASVGGSRLRLDAVIAHPSGAPVVRDREEGACANAAEIGSHLAERMLDAGGARILAELDDSV